MTPPHPHIIPKHEQGRCPYHANGEECPVCDDPRYTVELLQPNPEGQAVFDKLVNEVNELHQQIYMGRRFLNLPDRELPSTCPCCGGKHQMGQ